MWTGFCKKPGSFSIHLSARVFCHSFFFFSFSSKTTLDTIIVSQLTAFLWEGTAQMTATHLGSWRVFWGRRCYSLSISWPNAATPSLLSACKITPSVRLVAPSGVPLQSKPGWIDISAEKRWYLFKRLIVLQLILWRGIRVFDCWFYLFFYRKLMNLVDLCAIA